MAMTSSHAGNFEPSEQQARLLTLLAAQGQTTAAELTSAEQADATRLAKRGLVTVGGTINAPRYMLTLTGLGWLQNRPDAP